MDEIEDIATGSESGAGDTTQTQGVEATSQEAVQSQTSESTQVEGTSTNASSKSEQPRSNLDWALQRQIEKAVKKTLQSSLKEQLNPLIESLKESRNPAVAQPNPVEDVPDFQNLGEWTRTRVNTLLQEALKKELPAHLDRFKEGMTSTFKAESEMQEARNYLISQKDIGRDQAKLNEIKKVIEDNLWEPALDRWPLRTAEKAVEAWRKMKSNPAAPTKGQLSGVSGGGAGVSTKRELGVAELKALQDRLLKNPTFEEQEAIYKQIESAVSA